MKNSLAFVHEEATGGRLCSDLLCSPFQCHCFVSIHVIVHLILIVPYEYGMEHQQKRKKKTKKKMATSLQHATINLLYAFSLYNPNELKTISVRFFYSR